MLFIDGILHQGKQNSFQWKIVYFSVNNLLEGDAGTLRSPSFKCGTEDFHLEMSRLQQEILLCVAKSGSCDSSWCTACSFQFFPRRYFGKIFAIRDTPAKLSDISFTFPTEQFRIGLINLTVFFDFNTVKLDTNTQLDTRTTGTSLKFVPQISSDTIRKGSEDVRVVTRLQCITGLTQYESKSFEEIRAEDKARSMKVADEDISSRPGAACLIKGIQDAFENPRFSDVTLKVGDVEYPAHKVILANRSKVFDAMFESGMKESHENVVNLVEMKPCTAKEMLRYIYTGKIQEMSMDKAINLYMVADRYDMPELKKWCKNFLLQHISAEFVCDVAVLADLHDDEDLKIACKRTIKNNLKTVLRSEKWTALSRKNSTFYFQMLQDVLLDDSYSFAELCKNEEERSDVLLDNSYSFVELCKKKEDSSSKDSCSSDESTESD